MLNSEGGVILKRKRDEIRLSIRRKKLGDMLANRRLGPTETSEAQPAIEAEIPISQEQESMIQELKLEYYSRKGLISEGGACVLKKICRVASNYSETALLFESGMIAALLDELSRKNEGKIPLLIDILLCLNTVTSHNKGQYAPQLIALGYLNRLCQLLEIQDHNMLETVLFSLENIARSIAWSPNELIDTSCILHKMLILTRNIPKWPISTQKRIISLISSVFRSKPVSHPYSSEVSSQFMMPLLHHFLQGESSETNDEELIGSILETFVYGTENDDQMIDQAINMDLHKAIVPFLNGKNPNFRILALQIVGNLSKGDEYQAECLVSAGYLQIFSNILLEVSILETPDEGIQEIMAMIVGNMSAISQNIAQEILQSGLLGKFDHFLGGNSTILALHIVEIYKNLLSVTTLDQTKHLVDSFQLIEKMLRFLDAFNCDPCITVGALGCLDNILRDGEQFRDQLDLPSNPFRERLIQLQGTRILEELQGHLNEHVYRAVYHIIDRYFFNNRRP